MIGEVNKQLTFTDAEIFKRIPQNNILIKIKKAIDFDKMAKKLECYYDKYQGTRSKPIVIMIKTLFLCIYYNVSERLLEQELGYNYLYRYFCDLGFYDKAPDHSTISRFMTRIGEKGAQEIFDEIVHQCKKSNILIERTKIVDATHVQAYVSKVNIINLLRQGKKKILQLLKKDKKKDLEKLEKDLKREKKVYSKPTDEEIEREIVHTESFIKKIKKNSNEKVINWITLLEETIQKIRSKTKDRIASFIDIDARWGAKSKTNIFLGYKIHTVQDESRIVTSVETYPGNTHEGTKLLDILKSDQEKGISGTVATADKLYDSLENRKGCRNLGLTPHILSKKSRRKIDEFEYDHEHDTLKCKAGINPIGRISQEKGWLFYFSTTHCQKCEFKSACLTGKAVRQRVYLSESEQDRLLAGKDITRKEAQKIRSTIEPKYGEGKEFHGLARARWHGISKVAFQAFMTFAVMNAKKFVRLLETKESNKCLC